MSFKDIAVFLFSTAEDETARRVEPQRIEEREHVRIADERALGDDVAFWRKPGGTT